MVRAILLRHCQCRLFVWQPLSFRMPEEVAVLAYQEAYQTHLLSSYFRRQGVDAPVHLSFCRLRKIFLLEESANLIRNRVQEAVAFLKEKGNTRE